MNVDLKKLFPNWQDGDVDLATLVGLGTAAVLMGIGLAAVTTRIFGPVPPDPANIGPEDREDRKMF